MMPLLRRILITSKPATSYALRISKPASWVTVDSQRSSGQEIFIIGQFLRFLAWAFGAQIVRLNAPSRGSIASGDALSPLTPCSTG